MEQKEKELLIKELSARLSYGVMMTNIKLPETHYPLTCDDLHDAMFDDDWDDVPYLLPESSIGDLISPKELSMLTGYELYDWYNKNHVTYRTLDGKDMFELDLAVRATKEMYNN